eukprot:scaffold98510_cov21-Tisochrysis_lutea.AAC.3
MTHTCVALQTAALYRSTASAGALRGVASPALAQALRLPHLPGFLSRGFHMTARPIHFALQTAVLFRSTASPARHGESNIGAGIAAATAAKAGYAAGAGGAAHGGSHQASILSSIPEKPAIHYPVKGAQGPNTPAAARSGARISRGLSECEMEWTVMHTKIVGHLEEHAIHCSD